MTSRTRTQWLWVTVLGFLLFTAPALFAPPAAAQQDAIQISVPDLTKVSPGATLTVPITLDSPVTASDGVASYTIKIDYDENVIDITGIDDSGTLTEGWVTNVNVMNPGRINASASNATSLDAASGTIVNLTVTVSGNSGSTALSFTDDTALGDFDGDPGTIGGDLIATGGTVSAGNALVTTEVHADPADGPDGDANGDGSTDAGDQFVEIVNTGTSAIDLTGFALVDGSGTVLHTFGALTLDADVSVVVFGGGTPTGIEGEVVVASSGGLGLDGMGGTVALRDDADVRLDGVTYGPEANADQSVTRAPGFTDAFEQHTLVGSGARYSPGATPDGTALPVELGSFTATPDGAGVVLAWTTASETNNAGFGVEQARVTDGVPGAFAEIAFVAGAGTTSEAQRYTHRVQGLQPGTYRFRLRQQDVDGTSTLSTPREVVVAVDGAYELEPSGPNPFRERTALSLRVRRTQPVRVDLYNVLGQHIQIVFDGTVRSGAAQPINIDGTGLASGVYLYRITGRTFTTTGRLTRVR